MKSSHVPHGIYMIVARISHNCYMYVIYLLYGMFITKKPAIMMNKRPITVKIATKNNFQIETTSTKEIKKKKIKENGTADM